MNPPRTAAAKGASQSKVRVQHKWSAYLAHHRLTARESLTRLLKSPVASTMTWLVLAIALALPMTLYVSIENVKQLSQTWDQTSQVSVYLKTGISDGLGRQISEQIEDWPQVNSVSFVDADQALKEFSAATGLNDVLGALKNNPLPAVISIVPNLGDQNEAALVTLQEKLQALPSVDSVQMDMAWVKRLYQFMELGQRLVWSLGVLLGVAVLLIVGNTIRLSIEARRDEIVVVKLVGGTDPFVRRPFLYTGIWYGLGGGIIAWCLLNAGLMWLANPIEQLISLYGSDFSLKGLGLYDSVLLIFDGVALGWFGAWLAVSRHLQSIEP